MCCGSREMSSSEQRRPLLARAMCYCCIWHLKNDSVLSRYILEWPRNRRKWRNGNELINFSSLTCASTHLVFQDAWNQFNLILVLINHRKEVFECLGKRWRGKLAAVRCTFIGLPMCFHHWIIVWRCCYKEWRKTSKEKRQKKTLKVWKEA